MTETRHSYTPGESHNLAHDPMNAIVGPRPIGWISTVSDSGVLNLAPYSFFNLFNYSPPILGFCSIGWKDSVANAQHSGEFVWNLATRDLAEAMNESSTMDKVDEFGRSGLTPVASDKVGPPRVGESPVQMECRTTQIIQLLSHDKTEIESWLVLGEVVRVHIHPDLISDGVYQTARARPILRGGGWGDYFELGDQFQMRRPG